MLKPRYGAAFGMATLALAACADRTTAPIEAGPDFATSGAAGTSYIILGSGNVLPGDLAAAVVAAGGTLTGSLPQIGVAFATSGSGGFAAKAGKIKGVQGVAEDVEYQWIDPNMRVVEMDAGDAGVGDEESFRLIQWAPDAVSAPAAWETGARGAGARVAILDGGIRDTHQDIAANLDATRSKSFVPGQPFNFDQARNSSNECVLNDTFWHGTHVAGIVAAPINNLGTVGIAPEATIIGVKVLHCGSGFFSWIIDGMMYAATPIAQGGAGADIINMSLGGAFFRQGPGAAQLAAAVSRAATWAYQQGSLVLAAAGNNAWDLDHTANLLFIPAQSTNALAISALGPMGWAVPGTTADLDRPASYTNYGQSAISLAGPGGDFALPGTDLCSRPRLDGGADVVRQCWVFDMVMAPCRGSGASTTSYCWAAGTSMATPAVAGVAALIVGKYGKMHPAQLEARLRMSADDLGKPGNDDFYGRGRVNALRAVQ